jgi:ABC-type uncharacterized transport system permease subunit
MNQGPEKFLTRLEMPAILVMGTFLFGAAVTNIDLTLWRIAMMIPFTAAGAVLFFALYAAAKHTDRW